MYKPRYLFLITLLASSYCLSTPVTINGRNIRELLRPGQSLSITPDSAGQAVMSFKENNLLVTVRPPSENINHESIRKMFENLSENIDKLGTMNAGTILNLDVRATIDHRAAYLLGGEKIVQTGKAINMDAALLKSPEMFFIADTIDLISCYSLTPSKIQFRPKCESSIIKFIEFKLTDDWELPYFIQGKFNFEKNSIEDCILFGVEQIEIIFNDTAFE